MEYLTEAIVLSHSDVKEHDRLFSFYTKNLGKTTVLAKGVRRSTSKMAGQLEPFAFLMIKVVDGRGNHRLSSVETMRRYQNILKDLELIKIASSCLTLVDSLVKEGSCDLKILELSEQILGLIDDPKKDLPNKRFLAAIFKWQLVGHLGYRPELYYCLSCKKKVGPLRNSFNFLKGGLLCADCYGGGEYISEEEIKILRLMISEKLDFFNQKKIPDGLIKKTEAVVDRFTQVVKG